MRRRAEGVAPGLLDTARLALHRLVTDWWRDHPELVEAFLARFDEGDVPAARGHLRELVRKRCWVEAQRQAANKPGMPILILEAELGILQSRVESQRRAAAFGNLRQVQPDISKLRPQAAFLRTSAPLEDDPLGAGDDRS